MSALWRKIMRPFLKHVAAIRNLEPRSTIRITCWSFSENKINFFPKAIFLHIKCYRVLSKASMLWLMNITTSSQINKSALSFCASRKITSIWQVKFSCHGTKNWNFKRDFRHFYRSSAAPALVTKAITFFLIDFKKFCIAIVTNFFSVPPGASNKKLSLLALEQRWRDFLSKHYDMHS